MTIKKRFQTPNDKKSTIAGCKFFGNLVDLDCEMQDLKLILQKTEEMFPDHDSESESLIMDIFPI
jgi:hypothetical protein